MSIVGCEVDESNIKNIQILGGNTAKPYMIEYETRTSEHITEDFENCTDDEKAGFVETESGERFFVTYSLHADGAWLCHWRIGNSGGAYAGRGWPNAG